LFLEGRVFLEKIIMVRDPRLQDVHHAEENWGLEKD
jgi:hypothetical protein